MNITLYEWQPIWGELCNAFSKITKEAVKEAYYNQISSFDTQIIRVAIKQIIRSDDRFPSIARILKVCYDNKTQKHEEIKEEKTIFDSEVVGTMPAIDRYYPRAIVAQLEKRISKDQNLKFNSLIRQTKEHTKKGELSKSKAIELLEEKYKELIKK